MSDKSDYKKPRTKLLDLLPEVYDSDTNRAVFSNLFDRFLTKQETVRVAGYIGQGNPNAVVKRQIKESDVHRQGYQLQPILYNKIGSEEKMASWMDLLHYMDRLGIDPDLQQQWMQLIQFNWAPPINLDKLIHYQDYYWYDPDNPTSRPQYITIRSRCATATAMVNFYESLIDDFGGTFSTTQAKVVDDVVPNFSIINIVNMTNQIFVEGDITEILSSQQYFSIQGTSLNDGVYKTSTSPTYDLSSNISTIVVDSSYVLINESNIGQLVPRKYDKLVITGDYRRLFEPGFTFYYKNSSNDEINNALLKVKDVDFDSGSTIITITTTFTDDRVDGVISIEEKLSAAYTERDCQCKGSTGWDTTPWDDNPNNPLWADAVISSISHSGAPVNPGTEEGELWWDTTSDTLYQYYTSSSWNPVQYNFSVLVDQTKGNTYWDLTQGCGQKSVIQIADQWINENKWLHKNDVPNFATAKQAQIPIIEYEWDLELNEWTYKKFTWKYRSENYYKWNETTATPELIELLELSDYTINVTTNEIYLSSRYGDLTSYFVPGKTFTASGLTTTLEVESSKYESNSSGLLPFTTIVVKSNINDLQPSLPPLHPIKTSQGDHWKGYDVHWVLVDYSKTVPVNHQPVNPWSVISGNYSIVTPDYESSYTFYAQKFSITSTNVTTLELHNSVIPGGHSSLREMALLGSNDIRVYRNGIRQYGNYQEFDNDGNGYVTTIVFNVGHELNISDEIIIEVGESTPLDFGWGDISVRTIEDDDTFNTNGPERLSLIRHRKEEQVKTQDQQYPLFDIYNVDGTPAYQASPIFKFATDSTADVNQAIGMRLVTKKTDLDYVFEQTLLDSDQKILAYRDYANLPDARIWVNPNTSEVKFWDGFTWSFRHMVNNYYEEAVVSDEEPYNPYEGLVWYNPDSHEVKQRQGTQWIDLPIILSISDPTLQTIWKKGLNDEKYIPEKRDWERRSLAEYDAQKTLYVTELKEELQQQDPNLSDNDAAQMALGEWLKKQQNHLSPTGEWIGDWEIPDPLYFNHNHENREQISFNELLTHFTTIIDAQPKIPGFNAARNTMFRLIPANEVNFGLGGKIKEYDLSFDSFLSSLFIEEISPTSLIDFAADQYESQLSIMKDLFRKHCVDYLIKTDNESILNLTTEITNGLIDTYQLNDAAALVYGDSTTYIDTTSSQDVGIKNWIMTTPFTSLYPKTTPVHLYDPKREINAIVHHDGHIKEYALDDAIREGIIQDIITTEDPRSNTPLGVQNNRLPPNTTDEFSIFYNTTIINREGVYWYDTSSGSRTLYRLNVVDVGDIVPSSSLPDGSLWLDLRPGMESLRVKETNPLTGSIEWNSPPGLTPGSYPIRLHNGTDPNDMTTSTVTAWKIIDIERLLQELILSVERKLFEAVPKYFKPKYDISYIRGSNKGLFDSLMETRFASYVKQREIVNPYANVDYNSTDAFTWNYKHSVIGAGIQIVGTDTINNAFVVPGQVATFFNQCLTVPPPTACNSSGVSTQFYIKNSSANDGTWNTIPSTLTSPSAVEYQENGEWFTKVFVDSSVNEDQGGIIYKGLLPTMANTGGESGGDWRDLYQKIYGTPYPHLEPWIVQGYREKPEWWDREYLNDDSDKWGNRRWKYKHGFDIVGVDSTTNVFEIDGDFREVWKYGDPFVVDKSTNHQGSWKVGKIDNIVNVIPGTVGVASFEVAGDKTPFYTPNLMISVSDTITLVHALYKVTTSVYDPISAMTRVFIDTEISNVGDFGDIVDGITYDYLTNRSSLYIDTTVVAPFRNTITSSNIEGRIAIGSDITNSVGYGMWENIRAGIVPNDYTPPDNLRTYNYFSVNITNDTFTSVGNYQPDDVFPPYWDYTSELGSTINNIDRAVRSLFSVYSTEIKAPGSDYVFGDAGPIEWEWRNSSQFLYDQMIVCFQTDPVNFFHSTFGPEFYQIAGLNVEKRTGKVMSHARTLFHGDIYDTNKVLQYNGLNQWYVNFARYIGLDISSANMRNNWTNWIAPMTYQFNSFIDTPSLDVAHRYVCISEFDYNITSKHSIGVEDFWQDSLDVYVSHIPPKVALYDNDDKWQFTLDVKPPQGRLLQVYDVRNYQFRADVATDVCTIYSWDIKDINVFFNTFSINGNQTNLFTSGRQFTVKDSTNNNGTYTIEKSYYDPVEQRTIVHTIEDVSSPNIDGIIDLKYRKLPWVTGDKVVLSSNGIIPTPLQGDNANGVVEYFIIVLNDTEFKLALTRQQALDGQHIDVTATNDADHFVGQIHTTFNDPVSNTKRWRHYVIDTTNIITFSPPFNINGIQNVVNIVDGYEKYQEEHGWRYNSNNSLRDPENTGLQVSWHEELRRFIEYLYKLRANNHKQEQKFFVNVDDQTNEWSIIDNSNPMLITGDVVSVGVMNGILPNPLIPNGRYYIIRDTLTTFRLAATKNDALSGIEIDIQGNATGDLYIFEPKTQYKKSPKFEINAFRNGLWFRPTGGIISDLTKLLPYNTSNSSLVADQYGSPIPSEHLHVYREDKETAIAINEGLVNTIEQAVIPDPYNYIHLGVVHILVDKYEHALKFNYYNSEDQLLYDPFLGLNVTKFEMLFNRQLEPTQRPNVGGYYLLTDYNQGAELKRNFESSVEDIRTLYDTYTVIENNQLITQGRESLGYEGARDYLNNLNINEKSQFAFWRGQIQHKGAMTSVQAFINSRRFIDAKVDEYWAVKIAEFGSNKEHEYLDMLLIPDDSRINEIRLQFVGEDDLCYPGYDTNPYDNSCGYSYPNGYLPQVVTENGFVPVTISDTTRWFEHPDQVEKLLDNGGTLYFDLTVTKNLVIDLSDENTKIVPDVNGSGLLVRHNFRCDFVTVTLDMYSTPSCDANDSERLCVDYNIPSGNVVKNLSLNHPYIPFTNMLTVYKDGVKLIGSQDFNEVLSSSLITDELTFKEDISGSTIRVVYGSATLMPETHFDVVNSNIIEIPEIVDDSDPNAPKLKYNNLEVWGWMVNKEALTPEKIIDVKSETVVAPIQLWDPARGYHFYNALHSIDIQTAEDPAFYSNTLNETQATIPGEKLKREPWNNVQVGTTWLDTLNLDYQPYYDSQVFSDMEIRFRKWGEFADWVDDKDGVKTPKIYEWVKSDVHPRDWNDLAQKEETDVTMPQKVRKSGRTFKTVFRQENGEWIPFRTIHRIFDPKFDGTYNPATKEYTIEVTDNSFVDFDSNIFINGRQTDNFTRTGNFITIHEVDVVDRINVVTPPPTDDAVIQQLIDDGKILYDYQYTEESYIDSFGQSQSVYFFWVENKLTKGTHVLSPVESQKQMTVLPIPYLFFSGLRYPTELHFDNTITKVPLRFVQAIIRGLKGLVEAENRYILRWVRDFTLRDSLDMGLKKTVHEEWKMIRRAQPNHIDKWLWDKITESIVGYKLSDPTIRVPSLTRELYDTENNTTTRYGLGDDQAFVNGDLALKTILQDLINPNNDFSPVDINVFFSHYRFDTPENIIEAMDAIYSTFKYVDVNRMFFDVLLDALSGKRKYADIIKTSMVALHGVRPFQSMGLLDD